MKSLPVKESIVFAWKKFKEQPGLWVLMTVILLLPSFLSGFFEPERGVDPTVTQFAAQAVLAVASFIICLGIIQASLNAVDQGKKPVLDDILSVLDKRIGNALLCYIIVALMYLIPVVLMMIGIFSLLSIFLGSNLGTFSAVLIGLAILGFVAAIYLSVRVIFVQHYIVDKSYSAIDSIKASFADTKSLFWPIVGYLLLIAVINIAGVILFVVGLLVTIPVTIMATSYIYRSASGAVLVVNDLDKIDQVVNNVTDES